MSKAYRIKLIGGPRDGEELESRTPQIQGEAYTIEEGRYVVLGEAELLERGRVDTYITHAFFEPERAPTPSRRPNTELLERMALGVIVGIMWAGVGLSMAFMFWLGGQLVSLIGERVPPHVLTILIFGGAALLGAGWAAIDYLSEDQ